jgi:hypothetical protein
MTYPCSALNRRSAVDRRAMLAKGPMPVEIGHAEMGATELGRAPAYGAAVLAIRSRISDGADPVSA